MIVSMLNNKNNEILAIWLLQVGVKGDEIIKKMYKHFGGYRSIAPAFFISDDF